MINHKEINQEVKKLLEGYVSCYSGIMHSIEWGDQDTENDEKRMKEIEERLIAMCEGKNTPAQAYAKEQ